MKNYSEMSDFEINKEVAIATGLDLSGVTQENYWMYNMKDYCNSWADAGPIIEKFRITIDSDTDVWFASDDKHCHTHYNPLRAAMIVFLMMMKDN